MSTPRLQTDAEVAGLPSSFHLMWLSGTLPSQPPPSQQQQQQPLLRLLAFDGAERRLPRTMMTTSADSSTDIDVLAHPLATDAAQALARTPGLDTLLAHIERVNSNYLSTTSQQQQQHSPLAATSEDLPGLKQLISQACDLLRIDKELYQARLRVVKDAFVVRMTVHKPNSSGEDGGESGRSVVVDVDVGERLLEAMRPLELQAVIAQQLAILRFSSVLQAYQTAANALLADTPQLGTRIPGLSASQVHDLKAALQRWSSTFVLCQDRAALLVAQDARAAAAAILTSSSYTSSTSFVADIAVGVDAALEQAWQVDSLSPTALSEALLLSCPPTHCEKQPHYQQQQQHQQHQQHVIEPVAHSVAVLRIREMLRFEASLEYQKAMNR
eukprot:jgi/Chlat1/615/Chrsp103S00961